MTSSIRFTRLGGLAWLAFLFGARPAAAEVTAGQRATAEALFQQGAQLMEEKRFNEACEKFAGSQELDPGLGTTLYLADCYEQAGKTASAWALFQEAADGARRAQQADRERIAAERAAGLEGRLSKLELRVAAPRRVPGLELRLNDAPVPGASWNVPMPLDPGHVRVEARAPGKKSWVVQIDVTAGPSKQVVEVPELANAPASLALKGNDLASGAERPAERGSTERAISYVVGAVGIVGLAAGGFFGYRAFSLNRQSKGQCRIDDPNACTPEGASTRKDAQTAGTLSTVASIGGGVLVATGVTLWLTAPRETALHAGSNAPPPSALPGLGLQLRGVW